MKRVFILGVVVLALMLISFDSYESEIYEAQVKTFNFKEGAIIYDRVYSVFIPYRYREYLEQVSFDYNVPVWIIARVIENESSWKEKAFNKNGKNNYDYGLMQLNSKNLKEFEWRFNNFEKIDYYDPYENIRIGVQYLQYLYKHLGSWELTVSAYNCGINRVRTGNIPISTQRYTSRILQYELQKKEINGGNYEWAIKF